MAARDIGHSPLNSPKPRPRSTCCEASVIRSLIAISERAPVRTTEAAARDNARASTSGPAYHGDQRQGSEIGAGQRRHPG